MNHGLNSFWKVPAFVGLVLCWLWTVFAKDYWLEKPFTQWNERETMALLTDSPWSRPNTLSSSLAASSTPNVLKEGQLSGANIPSTSGMDASVPIKFYVRWYSSLKVRQALGRLGQLRGALSEADVKRFLEQPMEDYAIAISTPVVDPFAKVTHDILKAKTFLLSKKDKTKKIELKSYASPKERSDNFAVFFFPRSLNGQPAVDPTDDEITFVTEIGSTKIRAVFKLARMMIDGKLDL